MQMQGLEIGLLGCTPQSAKVGHVPSPTPQLHSGRGTGRGVPGLHCLTRLRCWPAWQAYVFGRICPWGGCLREGDYPLQGAWLCVRRWKPTSDWPTVWCSFSKLSQHYFLPQRNCYWSQAFPSDVCCCKKVTISPFYFSRMVIGDKTGKRAENHKSNKASALWLG